jgi:O-antigen/teichoic acid export membrane protein
LSGIRPWLELLRDYTAASLLSKGLTVATGLLLVNLLSVREYALLTLALSGLTFISIFSDLGIGNALLFFTRKCDIENRETAPYWAAAMRLRIAFLGVASLAALAFLLDRGLDQQFGIWELACVIPLLPVTGWFLVAGTLYGLQLRLAGKFPRTYMADIFGQSSRLLIIGIAAFASALSTWIAIFAGLIGAAVSNLYNWRAISNDKIEKDVGRGAILQHPLPYGEFLRYVRPTIPNTVYFAMQAPLMVFMSSYFGTVENVAQVGALGRLAIVLGLMSGFFGTVALPKLARVHDDRQYLRHYLIRLGLYAGAGIVLIQASATFPGAIVWLLGEQYAHLEHEVVFVAASAVLAMWGGFAVAVNNARAWIRYQPHILMLYVIAQIALLLFLDLSTTHGVIMFGLWSALFGLILQLMTNTLGFRKPQLFETR